MNGALSFYSQRLSSKVYFFPYHPLAAEIFFEHALSLVKPVRQDLKYQRKSEFISSIESAKWNALTAHLQNLDGSRNGAAMWPTNSRWHPCLNLQFKRVKAENKEALLYTRLGSANERKHKEK